MPRESLVEEREMPDFLVVHVPHDGAEVWVGADHGRRLRFVDEGCGELAGLVDAELERVRWGERGRGERAYGAVEEVALGLRQGFGGRGGGVGARG